MLAAKKAKGASLKAAVMQEKLKEAKADAERLGREEAVRTMLGPRGGLPTLKADFLKLAALLHVPTAEKDTVDNIKKKIRPMIGTLRGHDTPTATAAAPVTRPTPTSTTAAASTAPMPTPTRRRHPLL